MNFIEYREKGEKFIFYGHLFTDKENFIYIYLRKRNSQLHNRLFGEY